MVYVLQISMHLTKNPYFETQQTLLVALKEGRRFVDGFLKSMPLMRALFKNHQSMVLDLFKQFQQCTRQMQSLSAHGKTKHMPMMAKEAPMMKKALEVIIYEVLNA